MARRKRRTFPLKQAIEAYHAGFNYNQIAKSLGYNSVTVSSNLRKAGVVREKTETEPLVIERLVPIEPVNPIQLAPDVEPVSVQQESAPEPKPPTKPWLQTENPWVPDIFKLRTKHQGFIPRWTDPNLIEKREGEGMQIARAEDWGEKSKQGDGAYKRRGMILMEMPEEIAESKRAYLKHKTDLQDPEILQKSMVEKARRINRQVADMDLHRED